MAARMPCLANPIDARIPAARADEGGARESVVTSDTRDDNGDAEGVHAEGPAPLPLPRRPVASLCTPRHVSRQMQDGARRCIARDVRTVVRCIYENTVDHAAIFNR